MEAKINIAKILKNKPEGTKLWTDMFGEVTLYVVTDKCDAFQVKHHNKEPWFDKDGKLCKEGVLCIYPSKSMRDWEKFAWKRGDVLVNSRGLKILFDRWANDNYTSFYAKTINLVEDGFLDTNLHTLASEKDAKSFIKCIEEKLGGKLNRETLKIEKAQPEFKDGDIVAVDLDRKNIRIFKEKKNDNNICFGKYYIGFSFNNEGKLIQTFKNYTADCSSDCLATEEEKQQLFDALAKEGKRWDAEKKEVVGLKPKVGFKPFDKVLVRNTDTEEWFPGFFEKFDSTWKHPYHIMNRRSMTDFAFKQCIPYDGNEHLLGTTKDVED